MILLSELENSNDKDRRPFQQEDLTERENSKDDIICIPKSVFGALQGAYRCADLLQNQPLSSSKVRILSEL